MKKSVAVLQLISLVWFFVTPWTEWSMLGSPYHYLQSLLRFMSIDSVMLYSHLFSCHPLFLLHSIFPSIRVSSKEWEKGGQSIGALASVLPTNIQGWLSVQFSHVWLLVMLWTAAHQASLPSPYPRVYSNSFPLGRWCHPTISSSVVPFSSCLQYFPASRSFPLN